MSTNVPFLVSLVESEILSNAGNLSLGDSALLAACFKVAAYAVPLPAETDRPGPPSDFLQLAVQVAWGAFRRMRPQTGVERPNSIDESILALVQLIGHDVKGGVDLGVPPAKMPRRSVCIGEAEWEWSPHHERWALWYISYNSSRSAWVMWEITPNWRDWGLDRRDHAFAMVASKGLDRRTAAMHMLVSALQRWESDEDLDCFHSVTPHSILSSDDFDAISDAVWGPDEGEAVKPLIDKNRMTNVIIEAWQARVRSLSIS